MRLNPTDAILYAYLRGRKALDRRSSDEGLFDPSAARSILVVSSTAIGDTLMSTPAIRAIRKGCPKARLVALFSGDNAELFSNNPHIDGVVEYRGGYSGFRRALRSLKGFGFDAAIILHGNEPQATPLCYLSGARFIFKLPNTSRFAFLLSNREPFRPSNPPEHAIRVRIRTAMLAGCPPDGERMDLFPDPACHRRVEALLSEASAGAGTALIGFQPGAARPYKRWPEESFAALGRMITESLPGARIAVTGSPAERPLCERVAKGIGQGAFSTAGRLALRELPSLIGRLRVLVTGDTGPMHMAIALGTPVVALFAATSVEGTGPLQDLARHTVIRKSVDCDPCVTKKCVDPKCMREITAEEVFSAVARSMKAGKGKEALYGNAAGDKDRRV